VEAVIFRFECAEHEEYGIKGWKPKWFPGADPVTGMGVAHDVMEHNRTKAGPMSEEMAALGAGLFIRGGGGYFSHKAPSANKWYQNAASDFPDHTARYLAGTHDWVTPLPGRQGVSPVDEWAELELIELRGAIRRGMKDEEDRFEREVPDWLFDAERIDLIIRHARLGYRWAARRYRCEYTACCIFQQIEKEADRKLEYATEGLDELHVRLVLGEQRAEVRLVEPRVEW
jgi:hypothetical protein